jgi:hypothetical protein
MCFQAGPNQSTVPTFAMATTKNAIAYLRSKYRIGPNGIITAGTESTHQQTIEKAFGHTWPQTVFNKSLA